MAIFHLNAKVISRGKGQSAIAAAAYRSGERLRDEQADEQKYYVSRAERIVFTDIMAPKDAPEWAHNRNDLWNNAERAEKRKDAQLAREIEVALPSEMTDRQREYLVKDFAREAFVRKGYAVDIAIHAPDKDSDERNYHAHLMVTRRTLGPEGFSATKDWQFDKKQLGEWREQFANLTNRHLERHGIDARVDHRSLKEQGIDREPTVHVGYAGMEIAARGGESDRYAALQEIIARNGIRVEMEAVQKELKPLEAASRLDRYEEAQQAAWRERVEARMPGRIKPEREALKVIDGATGAVSKLGDAILDILSGSSAAPRPGSQMSMQEYLADPAARASHHRAEFVAAREAREGDLALDRIGRDMESNRSLRMEDLRALTREHQEAIRRGGDDGVRALVDEARKRGDGRERD